MLTYLQLCSPMFRAAHVMVLSTYWMAIIRKLRTYIAENMSVLHYAQPDPRHGEMARRILKMTSTPQFPRSLIN
eukprot:7018976-Pyramimonas_sp.AAC.1